MKRIGRLLLLLALATGCGEHEPARPTAAADAPSSEVAAPHGLHTARVLSPVFFVQRKYRSMEGPYHVQRVNLSEDPAPELLWITGYRVKVVDRNGGPVSQEFLCHNNLSFDSVAHAKEFQWSKEVDDRLFTLSQGQFALQLPDGFGIPVMSNEKIELQTQVLNHNVEHPHLEIRHRVEIDVTPDDELDREMKPLFMQAAFVMALVEGKDGYFGLAGADDLHQGASCLPGKAAQHAVTNPEFADAFGRRFTGHWVVEPGRETRHTIVTDMLALPFDTTIHYIAVHLHPFAESLELVDLTTGETVWKAFARAPEEGIGLAKVDYFSSVEGLPVYKDHEYEIVSVYDNTTDVDQDAMATMFIYMLDKEAEKGLAYLRRRTAWSREARASTEH